MVEQFLTGVTENTPKNLQLNAGVLVKNYQLGSDTISQDNIIGATRNGGSLSIVPTVHQVTADGIPTNYKGMDRVDEWVITLNVTMLEFKPETIKLALGAAVKSTQESGYTKYTCTNEINDSTNYVDIYWIGALSNGKRVIIKISNGMNKSGLSLSFADKNEGTFPLSIIANYDYEMISSTTNKGEAPFAIYYPTEE